MSLSISVKLDTKQFVDRLDYACKEGLQAIRAGVNAAAVDAKRAFISSIPPDAAGKGATQARVRKQTSNIRRASAGNLSASFNVTGSGWDVSPKLVTAVWGNQHKRGSLTMSTFVVTGGGSVDLTSGKMFTINANGGQVILERKGSAAGAGKAGRSLKALYVRKIYSANPRTEMAQDGAVGRKTWDTVATLAVQSQVSAKLQQAFDGKAVADAPSGGE